MDISIYREAPFDRAAFCKDTMAGLLQSTLKASATLHILDTEHVVLSMFSFTVVRYPDAIYLLAILCRRGKN